MHKMNDGKPGYQVYLVTWFDYDTEGVAPINI